MSHTTQQHPVPDGKLTPWSDPFQLFAQWPSPAVVVSGPHYRIELVSDVLLQIWNCSLEAVLHQPYFEARKNLALEGLEAAFDQVYASGKEVTWATVPVSYTHEGETKTLVHRIEITPLLDGSNRVIGALAKGHDITREVWAQKKAEENEQLAHSFLNSSPDCVKILGLDGSLKYVNEKGLGLLELDDFASIQEKRWHNLLPQAGQQVVEQAIQRAAQGEKVQFEAFCPTLKGTPKWWDVRVEPVTNSSGAITEIISVSRDITQRVRNEQELSFRSLLLEAQLDNNPDAILLTTLDRKIIMGNGQFEQMWGLASGSLAKMGNADTLRMVQHQVANEAALQQHITKLYNDKTVCGVFEILFKDGRIIEQHSFPVVGSDGTCHARCWQCRDVTAQRKQTAQLKENEERLRTLTTQLEMMVNDRTAQLVETNKHLQRSNDELQQFAHVISHDLKEPLRKIKTFASRLHLESKNKTTDQLVGYLDKIQHSASRMAAMIDGILQYASLSANDQLKEPVLLRNIFDEIESDLELLLQEKQAILQADCLATVFGVPVLIYQLFYNLINNALKFSRPGVPPRIHVQCSEAKWHGKSVIQITVKDNGIGFNEQFAQQIFQPFSRLHSKDRYEGTGLGLSLCKKIVERHGGEINATSVEGSGSVFKVLLPHNLQILNHTT